LCITSVAAGTNHSLFLNVTNNIYSCGDNAFGQLGLANEIIKNEYKTTLQPVPFGSKGREDFLFTSIVCGGDCSFAVSKTGKLFAWGSNLQGQLGHHDRSLRSANGKKFKMTQEFPRARLVAGLVEGDKFVLEASCGSKHTIVLARERTELDDNKPEWLVIGADEKGPK
jgi:E3 ubiquitin-protein ligase HERC4